MSDYTIDSLTRLVIMLESSGFSDFSNEYMTYLRDKEDKVIRELTWKYV